MKMILLTLIVMANGMILLAQPLDEQRIVIPNSTQLPQDRVAIIEAKDGWWTASQKNYKNRMSWYNEAKFGCFVHWGVYSEPGGIWHGKKVFGYSEHLMRKERIPLEQYKKELVSTFNPVGFDADEWMQYVKAAGMKYFIITAKHHDGFAMYPSDAYPYDIRMTKWGKDPMEALSKAAHKYGIKFGFYYSHAFDWEDPNAPGNNWDYDNPGGDNWWNSSKRDFLKKAEKYVQEKSIPQIKELIHKYHPDILWFDTPNKLPLYLNIKILKAIREVDKDNNIVINGRLVRFDGQNLGDYSNTGDRAAFFHPTKGAWESIPTTNESYGYSKVDTVRKPIKYFIRLLCTAASKGGNILMNVGPMGNGKWDYRDIYIFKGIGKWLENNGIAVYGSHPSGLPIQSWGVTTQKGDTLYAHIYQWKNKIIIGGLRSDIQKAWAIAQPKAKIKIRRINSKDVEISLPKAPLDTINTVIALVLKNMKDPNTIRLLDEKDDNTLYTFDAEYISQGLSYGDGKPNRNYIKGWTNNSQKITWNLRLNKKTSYEIYLDYNTSTDHDKGTINISIGNRQFEVNYAPFPELHGTNRIYIGNVDLDEGNTICKLNGIAHEGDEFLHPIAIFLKKL